MVCDTGPLVAAADRDDQYNRACTDLFAGLHLARRAILVPAPVVAEVGYLLGRAGGAKIEAAFLRSIVQKTLTVVDLELTDYERMAELVEVDADFPARYGGRRCRRAARDHRDRHAGPPPPPRGPAAARRQLRPAALIWQRLRGSPLAFLAGKGRSSAAC
jgi:predicted nucleic acid-binding protein